MQEFLLNNSKIIEMVEGEVWGRKDEQSGWQAEARKGERAWGAGLGRCL